MNGSRFTPSALTVAVAMLAFAAPASAGTLDVNASTGAMDYTAASGEANQITIAPYASDLRFQDRGVSEVPLIETGASNCVIQEPWKVRCPLTEVTTAKVDLGDGADSFDGSAASTPTTVLAGAGGKTIATGAGNDVVSARNGAVDTISCGAGDDSVQADPADSVAADCEHVNGSDGSAGGPDTGTTGPTGGDTGGQAGGNVFHTPLGLTLPSGVPVPRSDRAIVALSCAFGIVTGCHGDLILELPPAAAAGATADRVIAARGHFVAQQRSSRGRRIGKRHFRLHAGQSAKLPVRIALRGHYSQVSRRKRHLRAVLRVVERDASGKVADVETRTVTLKLSNKWSRVRRRRHR